WWSARRRARSSQSRDRRWPRYSRRPCRRWPGSWCRCGWILRDRSRENSSSCNGDAPAGARAFDGGKDHGEAVYVVAAGGFRRPPAFDGGQEIGDDAGMAMRLVLIGRGGDFDILEVAEEAGVAIDDTGLEMLLAIPEQGALRSGDAPGA